MRKTNKRIKKFGGYVVILYLSPLKQNVMDERKLPNKETQNYGEDMRQKGYEQGYQRSTWDTRKRRLLREKAIRKEFDEFYSFLDDKIAENKKR